MPNHRCVKKHHSFFFKTELSDARMNEIDRFIDGLTHEQRNMIRDLLDDVRDETTFFGTEHD
jgi:hypothetical protein